MTALEPILKAQIRSSGPLTVAAFMEACLYHPQHGYYTRGLNFSATPPRDFLTAPDHTPLFGYTLANWVAKQWAVLGSPTPFTLAEAGPGRGSLMVALLTHLKAAHPACLKAAQVVLIETSPTLKALQSSTLAAFPHRHAASLAELPGPTILIANELLDAFPIHQYIHAGGNLYEVLVDIHPVSEDLCFITSSKPSGLPIDPEWHPLEGATLEIAPTEPLFLAQVAKHTASALLIDYGAAILPVQGGNTLQAVHRHQPVPPLAMPGEADLTSHVNFSSVIRQLGEENCTLTDLAPFLLAHGLPELGLQHPAQQPQLQRLLHPAQMGTLFKVLCFTPSTR